jgi:hypothetical protein
MPAQDLQGFQIVVSTRARVTGISSILDKNDHPRVNVYKQLTARKLTGSLHSEVVKTAIP